MASISCARRYCYHGSPRPVNPGSRLSLDFHSLFKREDAMNLLRQLSHVIFYFPLVAAFLLFSSPVVAQTFTTVDGNQIEVGLRPDKETIMLGETTYLSFEVKNLSGQDLCMGEGGDYRNELGRPESFNVTVVGGDGKAVPQPEVKFSMGGLYGCSKIPANGSHVIKLFMPHWATFESTGSFSIRVERGLSITNYSTKSQTSFTASVSANLKVIPTDEKKLGEVINFLGGIMLDTDNPESGRAIGALAFTADKRAIEYFARALEKFAQAPDGTDEHGRVRPTAHALSRFNDDLALAALKKAMNSPDENIRRDIAEALGRSTHPQAIELLLKMRKDSYYGVRLQVTFALGQIETGQSDSVLREMLKDENEYVRKAAQDYLSKRRQK